MYLHYWLPTSFIVYLFTLNVAFCFSGIDLVNWCLGLLTVVGAVFTRQTSSCLIPAHWSSPSLHLHSMADCLQEKAQPNWSTNDTRCPPPILLSNNFLSPILFQLSLENETILHTYKVEIHSIFWSKDKISSQYMIHFYSHSLSDNNVILNDSLMPDQIVI